MLDPTVIVEVSFRDPVDVTNSPEIVGDSPSCLVESVVIMMVSDINCSVVIGKSVSVDCGSIVATGDPKVN